MMKCKKCGEKSEDIDEGVCESCTWEDEGENEGLEAIKKHENCTDDAEEAERQENFCN
jgi:hypothetical protein